MDGRLKLSDEALAVFAFAIYHQLESGERVTHVVRHDQAGHGADAKAEAELEAAGLIRVDGERIAFTPDGEELLAQLISAMRQKAGSASG
jgi:hypothetical protein